MTSRRSRTCVGHLGEEIAAGKPVARVAEVFGRGLVHVEPGAFAVDDLQEHIRSHGEADAGVEEVAGVDDDGRAAALGLQRAQGVDEIVDGAVALEQMHVRGAAELMVERGREDDDGDLGPAGAQAGGDGGAELAGAEVVVEHGDVDRLMSAMASSMVEAGSVS